MMITECKALACQLIEIIFDFRHDNLVTKCVSSYKELEATYEKGSNRDRSVILDE